MWSLSVRGPQLNLQGGSQEVGLLLNKICFLTTLKFDSLILKTSLIYI